jgi:hypothetical protein
VAKRWRFPSWWKGGANKSKLFLGEEFIIRSQRKKKKRCISANQEGRLFLYLRGGGIE